MPRVYLIFHNQMFSDTVCAVLKTHPEIELVGKTNESDQVAADVTALFPDVVLVEESEDGPVVGDVRPILTNPRPYRLITLGLDANGMHVWSQTWQETVCSKDLVEAIVTAGEDEL